MRRLTTTLSFPTTAPTTAHATAPTTVSTADYYAPVTTGTVGAYHLKEVAKSGVSAVTDCYDLSPLHSNEVEVMEVVEVVYVVHI